MKIWEIHHKRKHAVWHFLKNGKIIRRPTEDYDLIYLDSIREECIADIMSEIPKEYFGEYLLIESPTNRSNRLRSIPLNEYMDELLGE